MYTYIEEFDKKIYLKYFSNKYNDWKDKIIQNFNITYFKKNQNGLYIDNEKNRCSMETIDNIAEYKKIYKRQNIVGTCNLIMQYLYNNPYLYESQFNFDKIRLGIYDIETSTKAPPHLLNNVIHSIGIYSKKNNKYYILAYHSDISNNLRDLKNTEFVYSKSEKDMLSKYIEIRREENFDVVAGWNNYFFDNVQISNRIQHYFGDNYDKHISIFDLKQMTIKRNQYREIDFPKYLGTYELDLMEMFKKYHNVKFPSYKLDYVANAILGVGKIKHQPDFDKFYEEEFENHCRYLHRDIDITYKLEETTQHIKRMMLNLYSSYASLDKMNSTLVMWEDMIWKELYDIINGKKEYMPIDKNEY